MQTAQTFASIGLRLELKLSHCLVMWDTIKWLTGANSSCATEEMVCSYRMVETL